MNMKLSLMLTLLFTVPLAFGVGNANGMIRSPPTPVAAVLPNVNKNKKRSKVDASDSDCPEGQRRNPSTAQCEHAFTGGLLAQAAEAANGTSSRGEPKLSGKRLGHQLRSTLTNVRKAQEKDTITGGSTSVLEEDTKNPTKNYPSQPSMEDVLAGPWFEGDIIPDYDGILQEYGPDVVQELVENGLLQVPDAGSPQNDLETRFRWSTRIDDVVVIPYFVPNAYSASNKALIDRAVKALGERSKVVKFVPRTTQGDYIDVQNGAGCSSFVGQKFSGGQRLSLAIGSPGCVTFGIVQHEFLHALGFWHEQSRTDRDEFVTINFDNIIEENKFNFEKATDSQTLGAPYDYDSVMHYGSRDFSKNGLTTIDTPQGQPIGQRVGADAIDIQQLQLLYQCVSGARTIAQATANPCTDDCKCWDGATGCNGNNNACQGSLVCISNECIPPGVTRPANNLCATAESVGLGSIRGSTTFATDNLTGQCDVRKTSTEVWYTIQGNGSTMVAETCPFADFDTILFVLQGACGNNLQCVAGDDDGCGGFSAPSRVEWESVAGTSYFIVVHGWDFATGEFELQITSDAPLPPVAVPVAVPVAAPVPAPTPGPKFCFASGATVQVEHQPDPVAMQDLRVGDRILTGTTSGQSFYERVYAFGHIHTTQRAEFLQIKTTTTSRSNDNKKNVLEITGEHMVFVNDKKGPVRADSLAVGDTIFKSVGTDDKHKLSAREQHVTSITTIERTGVYAPLTPSGTIVVGGTLVSAYAGVFSDNTEYVEIGRQRENYHFVVPLLQEDLIHMYLSPLRIACVSVSTKLCGGHDSEGVHTYVAFGMKLLTWGEKRHVVVQAISLALALLVTTFFRAIEKILFLRAGLFILLGTGLATWMVVTGSKKRSTFAADNAMTKKVE